MRSEAAPMLLALHAFAPLIYGAAAFLAWRFHSTRILFGAAVLAVADAGLRSTAGDPGAAVVVRDVAAILLPANLVALTFLKEKGFISRNALIAAAVLGVQIASTLLLCRPEMQAASLLDAQFLPSEAVRWSNAPQAAVLIFVVSALFLAARFVLVRNPVESGTFWALLACFAAFSSSRPGVWLMIGGAVLAVAVVENSYVMAFHDQLTGLPARRAFYRMASMLPEHYSLAMADVDHFKRFNDTYGHEIGDQVLRMVAARMGRVTGGGKAFRWGGEEFVILFPGKSAADALEHLELLRQLVETSSFVLRGRDRGRHTADDRGQALTRVHEVWVTVSIGVAEGLRHDDLHAVMSAADVAVYAAKSAGRNRVEAAVSASARMPQAAPVPR
jgi:diguanylate cyclase (GGDEF)-like protein